MGLMKTKPKLFVASRIQVHDVLLRFPNSIPVITLRGPRDPSLKEPRLAKLHLEVLVDDIQGALGWMYPPLASAGPRHTGRLEAVLRPGIQRSSCSIARLGFPAQRAAALGIHYLASSNPITGVAVTVQKLFAVNQFGHPNKLLLEMLFHPT